MQIMWDCGILDSVQSLEVCWKFGSLFFKIFEIFLFLQQSSSKNLHVVKKLSNP